MMRNCFYYFHIALKKVYGPCLLSTTRPILTNRISCIVFPGNPKPHLQWYLDGEAVTEGLYIMTMIHDITEREYHGCLQLDSPTHLNNGRYTLVATNKYGTDQKEVEAHFMRRPWDGEE